MLPVIKNPVLRKYMDSIIKAINDYNEMDTPQRYKLDIPFLISSLYQSFVNDWSEYESLIQDLQHENYVVNLCNDNLDDYILTKIETYIYEENDDDFMQHDSVKYTITFYDDQRYWGMCECTPDMPDYREDKECCGHSCDAIFCRFNIEKTQTINSGTWSGDEHDYWEFEDAFYENNKELFDKKLEREKKQKEDFLLKEIERLQKELHELRDGK